MFGLVHSCYSGPAWSEKVDSARSLTGRGRGGYVKTSNHNSHKQYHTDGQGNPNHGTYTDKNGKITNKSRNMDFMSQFWGCKYISLGVSHCTNLLKMSCIFRRLFQRNHFHFLFGAFPLLSLFTTYLSWKKIFPKVEEVMHCKHPQYSSCFFHSCCPNIFNVNICFIAAGDIANRVQAGVSFCRLCAMER